jgi:hypothetical protein
LPFVTSWQAPWLQVLPLGLLLLLVLRLELALLLVLLLLLALPGLRLQPPEHLVPSLLSLHPLHHLFFRWFSFSDL